MKRNYILLNKKKIKVMKKTYFAPETKVFEIKPTTVIAASVSANNELGNQVQLVNEEREDFSGQNIWGAGW